MVRKASHAVNIFVAPLSMETKDQLVILFFVDAASVDKVNVVLPSEGIGRYDKDKLIMNTLKLERFFEPIKRLDLNISGI